MAAQKKRTALILVNFRVTEKFKEQLREQAEGKEMSVTTYLKQLVLADAKEGK